MLIKKNQNKGFTLVEIMIVVVIIGLLAAMAIPAFQQVRSNAREKAITNNLRLVWGSAQQYMLDKNVASVKYTDLTTNKYFDDITKVAGEDYSGITVGATTANISVTSSDTSVGTAGKVTYP